MGSSGDDAGGVPVGILVPGYGGPVRAVDRWRMRVALQTLDAHGGGLLVVSGHGGEAERLAALAPPEVDVVLETEARSTFENVERSIPLLLGADPTRFAIATDRGHRRRAEGHLRSLRPDLAERLVAPHYTRRQGWWMDAVGRTNERLLWARYRLRPRT